MSKHTPGPWEVDDGVIRHPTELYPVEVARTRVAYIDPEHEYPEEGEAQANARLLAAAPELLAACKQALAWMEIPGCGQYELANDLRQAVAKAEGRS